LFLNSLEAENWPIFIVLKKNLKNAKKLGQFAASKLKCFKTIPTGNENPGNETLKRFLLEIRFPFSYLDFEWLPFPNHLS
jgi:hypothetical protein